MSEHDDRNWAEKRIDARRAERGLTGSGSPASNRLISGLLLLVVGVLLVTLTEGIGVALGVAALVGAAYQLVVAAIANGVREGRNDR